MREARVFALVGAVALACSSQAHAEMAQSEPISLDWRAPSTCPSAEDILQNVLNIRAGVPLVADQIRARVSVSREVGKPWTAEIYLQNAEWAGFRRLEGESCQALADAASLVLAFTLQERRMVLPAPREIPQEPNRWILGASELFDFGSLPSLSEGASLKVGWLSPSFRIEGDLSVLLPRSGHIAGKDWKGADFSSRRLLFRGCYEVGTGKTKAGPCAGLGVQWLAADGFGAAQSVDNSSNTLSASIGIAGTTQLVGALGVRYGAEAFFPLHRPSYTIEGAGLVYRPSAVAVQLFIGPQLRF